MSGSPEPSLTKLGPWPAGVNSVAPEYSLPTDPETGAINALREAVNVDINALGWPKRRQGAENRVVATRAHSLFGTPEYLLANVDGVLKAYDADFNATTIKTGVGARYISYAQVNDEIYWSNGVLIRRIDADYIDRPHALATPRPPVLTATVTGGMAAGEYAVSLTQVDAYGKESGASPAAFVTVPANGGIQLSNMPSAVEGAVTTRVYCTPPSGDGDVMYRAYELLPSQSTLYLSKFEPIKQLETAFLIPLPPGDIVRFWNGRVLVACQNQFCWSEALRFGLMHQDSSLRFGARITLMEPVGEGGDGSGVFIADHKRTYFLSGDKPNEWQRVVRYSHPAVPGTSITLPGSALGLETTAPVAFWLATNGVFVVGMPNGRVLPVTEGRLALSVGEQGATMFREYDGFRQLLTTFLTGPGNALGVGDSASATVRRNGVTVT